MKYSVFVKPKSKKESIEMIDSNKIIAKINAIPTKGEANLKLLEALAKYFKVPKSNIKILSGHKSKNKVIEILES